MATSTILARLEHRSHFFEHRRRRRRLLPSSLSLLLFPLKGFFYLRTDFSASLPLSPLADPLASLGRCGASRPQALEAIPRHRGESFGIPLAGHFILAPPCGREPFYLHLARTHTYTRTFLFLSLSLSSFFHFLSFSSAYSRFTGPWLPRLVLLFRLTPSVDLLLLLLFLFGFCVHAESVLSFSPASEARFVRARPMLDDDAGVLAWYPMVAMLRSTEGVQKVRGNCTTQLGGRCRTSLGPNKILTALCPSPQTRFVLWSPGNDLSLYFTNSPRESHTHTRVAADRKSADFSK